MTLVMRHFDTISDVAHPLYHVETDTNPIKRKEIEYEN